MNFVLEQCILMHDFSVRMLYYETLYYASLYYATLYCESLHYGTRDARDSTTCHVLTTWPRRVNRERKRRFCQHGRQPEVSCVVQMANDGVSRSCLKSTTAVSQLSRS